MKIIDIEKIINIYPDWKPSDIVFIKSIDWSNDNIVITFYCQLRSRGFNWPDLSGDFFQVCIKFNKISNLKLNFEFHGLQQVSGFDIVDISNNGLENINYEVEDYENGIINFYCKEVEIVDISIPFKL